MNTSDAILKYIRATRNAAKKDYATRYAIWLVRDMTRGSVIEPEPHNLTYMGAQSVRMALHTILRES